MEFYLRFMSGAPSYGYEGTDPIRDEKYVREMLRKYKKDYYVDVQKTRNGDVFAMVFDRDCDGKKGEKK